MHNRSSLACATLVLSSILAAQTSPGLSSGPAPSSFWNMSNPQLAALGTHIGSVTAQKLPCNPAGEYTVCLSVTKLASGFGGIAYDGLVMGTWNPNRKTQFVPNTYANALNSGGNEYGLHVDPRDGLLAVFDRFQVQPGPYHHDGVFLAARAADNQPFSAPLRVLNVQGLAGWADPALGYVDGKLKLFYVGIGRASSSGPWLQGILMADLVVPASGNPFCKDGPVFVELPRKPATRLIHSPTPIIAAGSKGEVRGLWYAEGDLGAWDSDMYFACDLDPQTAGMKTFDQGATWLNTGAILGGTLVSADSTSWATLVRLQEAHGAWLVGDNTPVGGSATITMGAYSAPGSPSPATAMLAMGTLLTQPVALPGAFGQLGIQPLTWFSQATANADQMVAWGPYPVPTNPALKGTYYLQGLSVYLSPSNTLVRTLTNTATLVIR